MELLPQLVPVWLTSIAAMAGVIYAIARNGRSSKQQDIELKRVLMNDMTTIKDRLDDPDTGLRAIKKETEAMKVRCIETSTGLAGQVKVHDDEIARLRKKSDR